MALQKSLHSDRYQEVTTDDGSITLRDTVFDEQMHSNFGARSESEHVYINGCGLAKRLSEGATLRILDVGFGIGQSLLLIIDLAKKFPDKKIYYYSFELISDLLIYFEDKNGVEFTKNGDLYLLTIGNLQIEILLGDARHRIKDLQKSGVTIDAIFQDPFSPQKNPTLWSVEWFLDLKELMSGHSVVATYSASSRVRKGLIAAGFEVNEFKGVGNKRGSTLACLPTGPHKTSKELLNHLNRSPVLPIRDSDL